MDWPKARAVMILAFMLVNAILAYSIWGPAGGTVGVDAPQREQIEQLRATLANRDLILPSNVTVPSAPATMHFLHVAVQPTPDFLRGNNEAFGRYNQQSDIEKPSIEPETGVVIYRPKAKGDAAHLTPLEDRQQVQTVAEEYLRRHQLLPQQATVVGVFNKGSNMLVEWVPTFEQYPVFAGSIEVEVSSYGIEMVRWLWVQPLRFTDAAPKSVRPASEALLRLAGRLGPSPMQKEIAEVRLGYYGGRSFTEMPTGEINGWDTVPVWRIRLESGETYYINAFNGEWES